LKDISDLISSVGFPIVVSLIMIYQQQKMSDSYIQIVESLKELINDNTNAITLLINRAKENDSKLMSIYNSTKDGVNSEDKQTTSSTVSDH